MAQIGGGIRGSFLLDLPLVRASLAGPERILPPADLGNQQPQRTVELQEIRKIVELMNEHGLTLFDMTKKDFHLKLKKGADMEDLRGLLAGLSAGPAVAAAPVAAAAPAAGAVAAAPALEGAEITSPMVGTFYTRSSPEAPPLVNVGDRVSVGQTLCIIEAMKVMNEIKAERSGVICAVVAEDGSPVQFGDVLFRIK